MGRDIAPTHWGEITSIQDSIETDYFESTYHVQKVDIERPEPLLSIGCHSNIDIEEKITGRYSMGWHRSIYCFLDIALEEKITGR